MDDELEHIGKVADAATEVAKASGKAIDAASDTGKFFKAVFGDLVVDGVGLVSDRLKFFRLERAALLAAKTQKNLADAGIDDTIAVPPKIALPLIEHATLEVTDDLHSMWAKLLTSAMSPDGPSVERSFVSILSDLSESDALVLSHIYYSSSRDKMIAASELKKTFKDDQEFEKSILNLSRSGIIRSTYDHIKIGRSQSESLSTLASAIVSINTFELILLTALGRDFCEAAILPISV